MPSRRISRLSYMPPTRMPMVLFSSCQDSSAEPTGLTLPDFSSMKAWAVAATLVRSRSRGLRV